MRGACQVRELGTPSVWSGPRYRSQESPVMGSKPRWPAWIGGPWGLRLRKACVLAMEFDLRFVAKKPWCMELSWLKPCLGRVLFPMRFVRCGLLGVLIVLVLRAAFSLLPARFLIRWTLSAPCALLIPDSRPVSLTTAPSVFAKQMLIASLPCGALCAGHAGPSRWVWRATDIP